MLVSPEGSGSVSVSVGGIQKDAPYEFTALDDVVIEAEEAAGYRFIEWSGNMKGSATPEHIVVNGNKDITAHFMATETLAASTGAEIEAGLIAGTGLVLATIDPATITDTTHKPEDMPYGLINISVTAGEEGRAVIRFYLPESAPEGYKWYKYSETEGWIDFSRSVISGGTGDGAEFDSTRTQVTVYITDNGPYDGNAADGVIDDPSGLGSSEDGEPSPSSDKGGGGCFISTLHMY
ncbi:MAG: hypothetical protein NT072_04805 [Deltaproteobacteria bacterium]|nr:hypothetical protein [Deltaproteobacteria bacterium]